MPYGVPRTEEERLQQHQAIYGTNSVLPARGYMVRQTGRTGLGLESTASVLLLLLGAGALIFLLGKK